MDKNFFLLLAIASIKAFGCIRFDFFINDTIKGALSGLRQFLATESPLRVIENAFYFTSKALFVLKIFKVLS